MKSKFTLASLSILSACVPAPQTPPPADQVSPSDSSAAAKLNDAAHCPVVDSRNWEATLKGKELTLTGEVDLPTPGYTIHLRQGLTDRAMPPSQQILISFDPPQGMVTQVIIPQPVRFVLNDALPSYRSIVIRCGDQALATITGIAGQK